MTLRNVETKRAAIRETTIAATTTAEIRKIGVMAADVTSAQDLPGAEEETEETTLIQIRTGNLDPIHARWILAINPPE